MRRAGMCCDLCCQGTRPRRFVETIGPAREAYPSGFCFTSVRTPPMSESALARRATHVRRKTVSQARQTVGMALDCAEHMKIFAYCPGLGQALPCACPRPSHSALFLPAKCSTAT